MPDGNPGFESARAPNHFQVNPRNYSVMTTKFSQGQPHKAVHGFDRRVHGAVPVRSFDPIFFHPSLCQHDRLWESGPEQQGRGLPIGPHLDQPGGVRLRSPFSPVSSTMPGQQGWTSGWAVDSFSIGALDYDYEPGTGEDVVGNYPSVVCAVAQYGATCRSLGLGAAADATVALPQGLETGAGGGRRARLRHGHHRPRSPTAGIWRRRIRRRRGPAGRPQASTGDNFARQLVFFGMDPIRGCR